MADVKDDDLPEGWGVAMDEKRGIPYYFVRSTGHVQWEPPTGPPDKNKKGKGKTSLAGLSGLGGVGQKAPGGADDADTFCGMGTVGEEEMAKSGIKGKNSQRPVQNPMLAKKKNPLGSMPLGAPGPGGGSALGNPFGGRNDDDDDDSEEEDDPNDFANPFKKYG